MSDNKKYYYLKLKETFFDSEEMKILESMKNGIQYQNLYFRLCLLSLKSEGLLLFKNVLPYDTEMLSTVLRVDIDTVHTGVEILQKIGLVSKMDNGTIFLTDIQSLIGKSSTEAERIKSYREKTKQIECNKSVQMYEVCTPELELELELELKKDIEIKKDIQTKSKKEEKHKHGEYKHILLSSDEYLKLEEEWGEPELLRMIKNLDEGIETKGYKYKNFNLTLRNWKKNDRGMPIPKPLSSKEKLLCPRCGAEVIAGLCTKCRIPVDADGKELK